MHETHTLGHFRGSVVYCLCVHVRADRPKAILGACPGHMAEDTARRNLAFLVAGGLPSAWRAAGWPKGSDFGLLGFT